MGSDSGSLDAFREEGDLDSGEEKRVIDQELGDYLVYLKNCERVEA